MAVGVRFVSAALIALLGTSLTQPASALDYLNRSVRRQA